MDRMKEKTIFGGMMVIVFCIFAAAPSPAPAATGTCNLTFFSSLNLPNTVFTCTAPYTACTVTENTTAVPAVPHCEIVGYINSRISAVDGLPYAIGFHLRLPDPGIWNQRFYFQGGGGTDGTLGDAGIANGVLAMGYAVVSTDAGHDNTIDYDPSAGGTAGFGVDPQARIDYGYNAVDQVTQTAKSIINSYYGNNILYSYFVGCSNGGRQAMVASQRFPNYFNGIVAGDPGFDLPKAAVAEAWNEQALAPLATELSTEGEPYLPNTFSATDLALASNAILAACDALDGLVDGIVDNYPACTNDRVYPQLKAIQCTGPKTSTCLSAGQIEALKIIYAGPHNSHWKPLYTDWQWDPGISGPLSLTLWDLGTPAPPNTPLVNNALNLTLGGGALPLIFVTPPAITPVTGLEAYIFDFNFDTDAPKIFETSGIYTESSMEFMTARSTDLQPFKEQGGKLIIYEGNSDGVFSPHDIIRWYNAMNIEMDGKAENFARLFMVPGMGHCGTGPGTTTFDTLTPLVNWVEKGIAPDSIIATAPAGTPWPGRTRPLCPYPKQTRYIGSGDINNATNFVCKWPHYEHNHDFDHGYDPHP